MRRALKGALIAVAIGAIAIEWVNERGEMLRVSLDPIHPIILSGFVVYQSMAEGLRHGRIGQVDLAAIERYNLGKDLTAPYESASGETRHEWVNYYSLDIGYSFIVAAGRALFASLPDNHLRAIALQLVVDAVLLVVAFFVFAQWSVWLGLLAAFLCASNVIFSRLASFAFYYYWDIPLTVVVLGSIALALERPVEAARWLTVAGLALGAGVWLRGSWWPIALFLVVAAAFTPVLRHKLAIPIVAFAVLATPQVVRSSLARGSLTLSTRTTWHVAMVGLGYYPNPYGLSLKDESVFRITKEKYGVAVGIQDRRQHDEAAKKEYLSIWRNDRGFVIRSFLGRLSASITGRTESHLPSVAFMPDSHYRVLALAGFVAMLLRGGARRLLALFSAGTYAVYVLLTCVFFYVGVTYDNVSQVAMLFVFVGGVEALLYSARRILDCDDAFAVHI